MRTALWIMGVCTALQCSAVATSQAQSLVSLEVLSGHAGHVDESWDNRVMIGGAARFSLTPRVAIGPEVLYLRGFEDVHELTLAGVVTYDVVSSGGSRAVVPFIVFGAGLGRRTEMVGRGPGTVGLVPYSSVDASMSGGAGVRLSFTQRVFVAVDGRLGWLPERRVSVAVGWRP